MKNLKRFISIIFTVLLTFFIFTACHDEIVKGDVISKAYYNLLVKNDSDDLVKIASTKEEADDAIKKMKSLSKTQAKSYYKANEFNITDKQCEKLYDAQVDAFKKLDVSTEIISESEDSQKVKLSTNYINIEEPVKKANEEVKSEMQKLNIQDKKEFNDKYINMLIDKIIEKLNESEPVEETKEFTYKCVKKTVTTDDGDKEVFVPEDMTSFEKNILSAVQGQDVK